VQLQDLIHALASLTGVGGAVEEEVIGPSGQADDEAVGQLVDMGFPEPRATKALILNRFEVTIQRLL